MCAVCAQARMHNKSMWQYVSNCFLKGITRLRDSLRKPSIKKNCFFIQSKQIKHACRTRSKDCGLVGTDCSIIPDGDDNA